MSNKSIFVILSLFVVGMIFSPLAASAFPNQGNFLNLKKAVIDINDKIITDIVFKAQGDIPKHNPGINWGYGIITVDELGRQNVIATTSHPELPIADSELQQSPADPVIHNHYVILGTDELCGINPMGGFNLAVADLTHKSPGEIFVKHNEAILKNLPKSVTGGNFNQSLVFTPGTDYRAAASFQLEYVEDELNSTNFAVCVVDIRALDPQEHSTVIIGEKDFYGYNDRSYDNYGENGYPEENNYENGYPEENNYENGYPEENNYENGYKYESYDTYD
jgi:hypothetical protein